MTREFPVASKDYTCAECGKRIPAGGRYEMRRIWKDGERKTVRLHRLCPPPPKAPDWSASAWSDAQNAILAAPPEPAAPFTLPWPRKADVWIAIIGAGLIGLIVAAYLIARAG